MGALTRTYRDFSEMPDAVLRDFADAWSASARERCAAGVVSNPDVRCSKPPTRTFTLPDGAPIRVCGHHAKMLHGEATR